MFKGCSKNIYECHGVNLLHLAKTVAKFENIVTEHLHRIRGSMQNITHYLRDKTQDPIEV